MTTTMLPDPGNFITFHWADYLVFALSLAITLGIGVFLMFYKRNQRTTEDFLMGERSLNFVAVALSILASLLNGTFIIGFPAEIHYYGLEATLLVVGIGIAMVIVAQVFVPKYHSLHFTSAYEYVERRFNYPTRVVASAIFCISVIFFLAVVLYVPALAFSQVTQLSKVITIVLTGIICTIYTGIGGMRAVVWTDSLQMLILLAGLVVMAILGIIRAGGAAAAWDIAKNTGRVNFNDTRFDPRVRHTIWTQCVGQAVTYLGLLISNQMMIQRYMTVPTARKAQLSLYIAYAMLIPLVILIAIIGISITAYYKDCDPLFSGDICSGDQIFPLFLMNILGNLHGIPGLITAAVFAASLSSVSSVINSLSAVCLEDFISPAVMHFTKQPLKDNIKRWIAIAIVIFFGGLTIGLSFVADKFSSKLVQATGTIWGVIGGPLAGVFIMGFFFPFCNSVGAIAGMIGGLIIALWISIGNILYVPPIESLNITYQQCSKVEPCIPLSGNISYPSLPFYEVSYGWYGVISIGTCIIIGVLFSVLWKALSESLMGYIKKLDTRLLYSCADNCCCYCPSSCKTCWRCGVDYNKKTDHEEVTSDEVIPDYMNDQVVSTMNVNGKAADSNGYVNQAYNKDNEYDELDNRNSRLYAEIPQYEYVATESVKTKL